MRFMFGVALNSDNFCKFALKMGVGGLFISYKKRLYQIDEEKNWGLVGHILHDKFFDRQCAVPPRWCGGC